MSRTAKINYKRITLSFPEKVVKKLRDKVGNGNMSQYVADLVEGDLSNRVEDVDAFLDSLRDFAKNVERKDKRSSLEILREIRYGKEN
ncbi:MAG: hypothetical protein V1679_02565 [Candidatus Peregrinibacteria bacterium]